MKTNRLILIQEVLYNLETVSSLHPLILGFIILKSFLPLNLKKINFVNNFGIKLWVRERGALTALGFHSNLMARMSLPL